MDLYHILVVILAFSMVFGVIIYQFLSDSWGMFVPMPSDIKYCTEMNWSSCIICYILAFILFPIFNIGKLIFWLFHVKRGERQ